MNGCESVTLWPTEQARLGDKSTAKVTAQGLYLMLERQEFRCALTGRVLAPETASLDHKLPMAKGGANTLDNAQIVHWDVNRSKETMTTEDFIAMCREVVAMADGNT